MARDNVLYIGHTAIACFNCVSVEYFMQRARRWEMLIEKLQEISSDVGFNGFAERGLNQMMFLCRLRSVDVGGAGLLVEYCKQIL